MAASGKWGLFGGERGTARRKGGYRQHCLPAVNPLANVQHLQVRMGVKTRFTPSHERTVHAQLRQGLANSESLFLDITSSRGKKLRNGGENSLVVRTEGSD